MHNITQYDTGSFIINVPDIALITKFKEITIMSKKTTFLRKKVYAWDNMNNNNKLIKKFCERKYEINDAVLKSIKEINSAVDFFIFPEGSGRFFFSG